METFYFLFNPSDETFTQFVTGGFQLGFIILFFCSLITTAFFYLVLGRKSGKYATYGLWFIFMFINIFLVFIITLFALAYNVFEEVGGLGDIHRDVWFFALLNGTLYAILFYLIDSILLNNLSKYSRYIPFNLFKK